jgi:Zn-finger nucleic acid-binding protein
MHGYAPRMTDAAASFDPATPIAQRTGCVQCHAPLQLTSHEGVQLLTCPRGHGVFINAEALTAAVHDRTLDRSEVEEREAEAAQGSTSVKELEASEGVRTCPSCGAPMAKRVYAYESGVATDVCAEHGVWLDQGELERIEAWYEAQERHLDADRAEWGGQHGKLEQIEQQHEQRQAEQDGALHWGPVGWAIRHASYAWARKDDVGR